MTELVITAPGELAVREALPPAPLAPGEVRIEIKCLSLCGSDLGIFSGTYGGPCRYPLRFGHEWAGVVTEVGAGVHLPLGTRVTGDCSRWCGACARCPLDRNLCERIEKFGITRDGFSVQQAVVSEQYLYAAPPDIEFSTLALTELFAVALRALHLIAEGPVLVVGAGPLGVATALAAQWLGYGEVLLSERDPSRRRLVQELLPRLRFVERATAASERPRSYGALRQQATFPSVVECAGCAEALNDALVYAAFGGSVITLGMGKPGPVDTSLLVVKGLRLFGSIGGTGAFPEAIGLLASHSEEALRMVTHSYPIALCHSALSPSSPGSERLKVQIHF